MRYCVLFPQAENVHLIKDVGMIAYKMNKLYGDEAFIACYKNGEYPYAENEVKGLKLEFMSRNFGNEIPDGLNYLRKNAKRIDVLQLFHVTLRSVFFALAFKHFNSDGKIFLKLDCTEELVLKIKSLRGAKKKLFDRFFDSVDVIGAEQQKLFEELKDVLDSHRDKLINIPNGIDYDLLHGKSGCEFPEKKDIILSVGRIGSPEKNIEALVKAFSLIDGTTRKGWTLKLVGPASVDFQSMLETFRKNNPGFDNSIILEGAVYDRSRLFEIYSEAKIYCCSSNFESFGMSLIEAAAFGDVIVSTDVGIAGELVKEGNGALVPINSPGKLAEALKNTMLKPAQELEAMSRKTCSICKENYDWDKIASRLKQKLMQ